MKNNRVAALRHLHDKLKSGEYDGTDVMAAWIAVEDLACLLERTADEPRAELATIADIFQHWLDSHAREWREHCKEEPNDDTHLPRSMPETPRRGVVKAWVAALRASQTKAGE
jgi:hypothetical protein